MRELLGRVGPSVQQFYIDGCKLLDGDVKLETGAKMLGHCGREIEGSVRSILRLVFLSPGTPEGEDDCDDEEADGPDEEVLDESDERREDHRKDIERIVAALALDQAIRRDVIEAWGYLATGRGRGPRGKGLHGRAHRRGLERIPPIGEADQAAWRELEGVMSAVLPPLEAQFSKILPLFEELAQHPTPTKKDLQRFRALPNTYTTRRHFLERATPGWLERLDRAGFFDQTDDAFAFDVTTEQIVPQPWAAGEYLARVGVLPECHDRFVAIVSRIEIPHEGAALDLVKAARSLPVPHAARVAESFATWVREQPRVAFIADELAALAVHVGTQSEGEAAAAQLLEVLLELSPDPRLEGGAGA